MDLKKTPVWCHQKHLEFIEKSSYTQNQNSFYNFVWYHFKSATEISYTQDISTSYSSSFSTKINAELNAFIAHTMNALLLPRVLKIHFRNFLSRDSIINRQHGQYLSDKMSAS